MCSRLFLYQVLVRMSVQAELFLYCISREITSFLLYLFITNIRVWYYNTAYLFKEEKSILLD